METKAVRLYGKKDLRLENFRLPELKEDEILANVVSDSICMSSYKASIQGAEHKRVPDDIHINPTIIGHEFCGKIVTVGTKWKDKYHPGQKFSIQPALNYQGTLDAPGYSFQWLGGNATYVIMPHQVMEQDCLLSYEGDGYFPGSLSEPVSCIAGAFHASYHTKGGSYVHNMGIKEGGAMALLAGAGPMGMGAIDYALNCDRRPGLLVVTEIDDVRLKRAAEFYPVDKASEKGIELHYLNALNIKDPVEEIKKINQGRGFDDVMVFAPVKPLVEMGDKLLGRDGCLNFFAGPSNTEFSAELNFYRVHYASTHITGTSGGNTDDMREALDMMAKKLINPAIMITHVGGLDAVIPTTLDLPNIPGGKKLIYTNIEMPLTAISEFRKKAKSDDRFTTLAKLTEKENGIWSVEAETFLLNNFE